MPWTTREWYPVLVSGKGLVLTEEWVLHQISAQAVQLVHYSGAMCEALVEEDGVCRVRTDPKWLPLPNDVVQQLTRLLNLV